MRPADALETLDFAAKDIVRSFGLKGEFALFLRTHGDKARLICPSISGLAQADILRRLADELEKAG